MKIDILKRGDLNTALQEQISKLFRQLSPAKPQTDLNEVLEESNQITLVYCEEKDKIIGIASMCSYKVISGNKGWIEDVVVDSEVRGKGIGRKLVNKLLEVGKEKKLSEILLFTEDHRTRALNLYDDLGFKPKDSRIYVLKMN